MATSFEDIYSLNRAIMTDGTLSSAPDNVYYYIMYNYLYYSLSEFQKRCYSDLTDRTDFSQEIYNLTGDGTDTYSLSPAPPSGCEFYVSIDGTETTSFTYNSTTEEIVFDSTVALNAEIYVGGYIIGQFTESLTDEEKTILSYGMSKYYVKKWIDLDSALRQAVYNSDIKIHSQANHNKVNLGIFEGDIKEFDRLINLYSYTNYPDFTLLGSN